MSHESNDNLLELASYHIDFWAGEGIGKVLEDNLASNDLEELRANLIKSAQLMFQLEYSVEPDYVY